MNLGFLTDSVRQPWWAADLDRPALSLEDDRTWTYRELNDHVKRYVNGLLELGVKPGDRVGILLYNSLEYFGLYLAITKMGAVAVRLNFRLAPEELKYALNDSGCSLLCLHDAMVASVDPIRSTVEVREYVGFAWGGEHPEWAHRQSVLEDTSAAEADVAEPGLDDVAMLMYTSGTTGRPKAAVWTHGTSMWFAAMQAIYWGSTREMVAMTSGPLYHVGGLEDMLLPALLVRGHAVMAKSRGFSIARIATVLERHCVTDVHLYPFMIYDLLGLPDLDQRNFSALRRVVTGGSPINEWAVQQFREKFPHVDLVPTYGMTEGSAIITGAAIGEPPGAQPDIAGKPMPLTEVTLVDEATGTRNASSGEVWVRGPAVAQGYWNKPEATSETFVDGWCRTGDLGRIDDQGFLVITGRKKDMIKTGGENVYPAEVEQVLTRHPAIQDAAVIAVPDSQYQEGICAIVVPQQGSSITQDEVIAHCREHLAGYKKPRHVVVVDDLPRTASGKVRKFELREQYAHLGAPEPGSQPATAHSATTNH